MAKNSEKQLRWLALIVSLVLMLVYLPAYAAEKVAIEPLSYADEAASSKAFSITPTIDMGVKQNSNFYKVDSNYFEERKVNSYYLKPGFTLGYQTPKTSIDLGYILNAYYYDDQDDVPAGQDDADELNYVGHDFSFKLLNRSMAKLTFSLDEQFYLTRDSSKADRLTGDPDDLSKYYYNRFTPMVIYQFSERFSTKLGYQNTIYEYEDENAEDSMANWGLYDFRYHFSPTASLAFDYKIWRRNYDKSNNDYTSNELGFVFRKEAKFLYYELEAGYHHRDFSNELRESEDMVHYNVSVTAQGSGLDRGEPRTFVTLNVGQNFNDSGAIGNFAETRDISIDAGHIFLHKIKTNLEGYYRISNFNGQYDVTPEGTIEERKDKRYGIQGTIGYRITRWMDLDLTAGYEDRNSNIARYDYDDKFVQLELISKFDFWR